MNRWTKVVMGAAMLVCAAGMTGRANVALEDARDQAAQGAVAKAQTALAGVTAARDRTVAVLPIAGGRDLGIDGRLRAALTAAGFSVVDAREELWDEIVEAIERGERRLDILDERTLVQFGRLREYQVVLYGQVVERIEPGRMVYAEIELHLSSLETREHLWGDRFAERIYLAMDMRGPVALDALVRKALQAAVVEATDTLARAPEGISAALLPLAGDLDSYATGLVRDAFSALGTVTLREHNLRTRAEARSVLRDQPSMADAVLVGAVRDLTPRYLVRDEILRKVYQAEAEIQLSIEGREAGDILWSNTGSSVVDEVVQRTIPEVISKLWEDYARVFIGLGIIIAIALFWNARKRVR